jgi:hypothetical protein
VLHPLEILRRHHDDNRPAMIGDSHRLGAAKVDQPPNPRLASIALRAFIRFLA